MVISTVSFLLKIFLAKIDNSDAKVDLGDLNYLPSLNSINNYFTTSLDDFICSSNFNCYS